MSDNYHQAVMGGTGANHVMMGTGDAIFWSDGNGNPTTPPSHIANPNPLPGSDDQYTVDIGFDGNFTECGTRTQPGILPIVTYLASLPYHPRPNCAPNHYYMVNNDNPGFLPTALLIPRASQRVAPFRRQTSARSAKRLTTRASLGPTTAALTMPQSPSQNDPTSTDPTVQIGRAYCNICNFESYSNAIMGNTAQRTAHIKDATDFFGAVG